MISMTTPSRIHCQAAPFVWDAVSRVSRRRTLAGLGMVDRVLTPAGGSAMIELMPHFP